MFWAWVVAARSRDISPIAKKEKDPARIGSATIKGASCLLYRTSESSFGHKNLIQGERSGPTGNQKIGRQMVELGELAA